MRKKQAVTSFFFLLQKQPNICSKHELLTCFSLVSLDSYWDRTLAVSPMCLSASQTHTQVKQCLQMEEGFFTLSVSTRVLFSLCLNTPPLISICNHGDRSVEQTERVCRQLHTSPSHLTCLCSSPLGLMGKLHSEALPHTPHPTPPPPLNCSAL